MRIVTNLSAYTVNFHGFRLDSGYSIFYDIYILLLCLFQERFTQDMQPHYIYSPREMTRWVRGIVEALRPLETLSVEGLVRLWAHEALRLFQDRYTFELFHYVPLATHKQMTILLVNNFVTWLLVKEKRELYTRLREN